MCTFISATINADANRKLVDETFERLAFRFQDVPSPKNLPRGRLYLAHSHGHCDCGTAVGSSFRTDAPPYTFADLEKLRKQGWSEGKIARWKEQKLSAEEKNERAEEDRLRAAHQDLASWAELIRAMLETPGVKAFGLMHDFYSHGPGYDDLPIEIQSPRPVEALDESVLYRLPQGVLIEWTP